MNSFTKKNGDRQKNSGTLDIQAFRYFVKFKANQYGHYRLDHTSRVRNDRESRSSGTDY